MMESEIYSFVFRGLLADQALDGTGRVDRLALSASGGADIAKRLPLQLIDEDLVTRAQRMAVVYTAIAAFENSVRDFIVSRLLEQVGENWWEKCVPEKRRKKAESRRDEENKIRWHAKRCDALISYTDLEDLSAIMVTGWNEFQSILVSVEWVKEIFRTVERSRNIIMHSGELESEDIERLRMHMRDWINQVGG